METIAFYSYKGGTGRTLAISQLGYLLASSGKRTCVLDFDWGAPGVPHKYANVLPGMPIPQLGLVEAADTFRRTGEFNDPLAARIVEPIGNLIVFPAGSPFLPGDSYWKKYTDPEFQAFLASDTKSDKFFDLLIERIREEYHPQFVLLDAPSGVSRIAAICATRLAKRVVLLTANHPEGLRGTNFILRLLQNQQDSTKSVQPKRTCALSRLPGAYIDAGGKHVEISEERKDGILREASRILNAGLRPVNHLKLFVLRSEPQLELTETLPIRPESPLLSSPLVQDYIDFFSDIVPDLQDSLQLLRASTKRVRPFLLVEEDGQMFNPNDQSLNVAFRIDTLAETFGSLVSYTTPKEADIVLRKAGFDAASRFSTYLADRWTKETGDSGIPPTVYTKLKEWCEFDSSVGFGKFEEQVYGTGTEGDITLRNNFLTIKRSADQPSLCGFMSGYIQRILETILEQPVVVSHDLVNDCAQFRQPTAASVDATIKGSNECVFRYRLAIPETARNG